MNIFTLSSENFGDGINKLFWSLITKKEIFNNKWKLHYLTTGSIMNLANKNSIILGTGFISKNGDLGGGSFHSTSNKKKTIPHKILSVRGPLTRNKLLEFGLNCPEIYGDPLILFPIIYDQMIKNEKNNEIKIGIIPHGIDQNSEKYKLLYKNLTEKYKVKFIDIKVGNNYKKLIDEINECSHIISSSLHGVIMGIVYKKKTCFIQFSNKVVGGEFKFQDFFKSINIDYKLKNLYDSNILNNIINVDYNKLVRTGCALIDIIPFISNSQKEDFIFKYKQFYNCKT